MIVYRIENEKGNGPYGNRDCYAEGEMHGCYATSVDHNTFDYSHWSKIHNTPTPDMEGLGRQDNDICAFDNVEQLYRWFSAAGLRVLHDYGYALSIIETSGAKQAACQCLISKDRITVIQRIPLTALPALGA